MSSSGNNSWRPIRRRQRGYTNGYQLRHYICYGMEVLRRLIAWTDGWPAFVFQVTELECVSGQTTVIKSQKTELNQTIEELEAALKAKEEVGAARCSVTHGLIFHCDIYCLCKYLQELERLKAEVESANEFHSQKDLLTLKLQVSYVLS